MSSRLLAVLVLGCTPLPGGAPSQPARVLPGIDVLLRDSVHLVRDKGVGLVTNQGGVDAAGTGDVERLLAARVRLVALFSPEHGFRGTAAPGEAIASTRDSATGLPIYSLYGSQRAPADSMLRGIDLLLVDLPDVGARTYTYLSTTIEVMRAAARTGRPVVILDRPNPIGGAVQGSVLEPEFRSFVGPLAMPMRHGLTLGELARLANQELALNATLHIVPSAGWNRALTIRETGLPFVPPSPNLKDPESLFHYPGTVLFEGTALSVGRGSDAPFRQIGAPWLDPGAVISLAAGFGLDGVRLEPARFTPVEPGDGKYPGVSLAAIRLVMTDPARYDPLYTAVSLLVAVQAVHPDRIGFRPSGFDRLAGSSGLRLAVEQGKDPREIVASWREGLAAWLRFREPFLMYR